LSILHKPIADFKEFLRQKCFDECKDELFIVYQHKYTSLYAVAKEKYVDSCGNKGLDETRRSQTERLISRPRKAEYFSEAMNTNSTSFVFYNQYSILSQPPIRSFIV